MSRSARTPTQQEIYDNGRCGHGYRPSDGRHCGQPSEPGAPFGYCAGHAREFSEKAREITQADPAYQSAQRIELGDRALDAVRWENLGTRRKDDLERLVRERAVRERAVAAQRRPVRRSRERR